MEGRTIVRPDAGVGLLAVFGDEPSMEGRTIVRPDATPPGATQG